MPEKFTSSWEKNIPFHQSQAWCALQMNVSSQLLDEDQALEIAEPSVDEAWDDEKPVMVNRKALYAMSISQTTGMLMIFSFFQYFGVVLGASGLIQGVLVSVRNLGANIFQYFWGKIADNKGRKIILAVGLFVMFLGSALAAMITELWQLFLVAILVAILGFMFRPAWIALLGDLTTIKNRGDFVGKIQGLGSFISIFIMLAVGLSMDYISQGRFIRKAFVIPFGTAAFSFLIAMGLAIIFIKESSILRMKKNERLRENHHSFLDLIKINPVYRRLLTIDATFNASMALLWPVLPFVTLVVARTWTEVVIVWIFFQLPRSFSQRLSGMLSDRFGRKSVLILTRFMYVTVPLLTLVSLLTGDYFWLIFSSLGGGIARGSDDTVLAAYTLDCSTPDTMARYYSILLTVGGIIMFISSLASGLILDIMTSVVSSFTEALLLMLAFITMARFVGVLLHFSLKVPRQVPT